MGNRAPQGDKKTDLSIAIQNTITTDPRTSPSSSLFDYWNIKIESWLITSNIGITYEK
jgi:hypothetical protein